MCHRGHSPTSIERNSTARSKDKLENIFANVRVACAVQSLCIKKQSNTGTTELTTDGSRPCAQRWWVLRFSDIEVWPVCKSYETSYHYECSSAVLPVDGALLEQKYVHRVVSITTSIDHAKTTAANCRRTPMTCPRLTATNQPSGHGNLVRAYELYCSFETAAVAQCPIYLQR